jgi:cellulose synthase/poly-beta-1,6-N-acetylglucosamine synthase-like glycosyltransferase
VPVDASVIVCTQGRQPLLARTLAALAAGPDAPRDVVVVVDGSAAAIAPWLPPGGTVRVIEARHPGLNHKRNRGVAAAASDRLLFTDDDCVPAPDWARAAAAALAQHEVVAGRVLPLNEGYRTSIRPSGRPRLYRPTWWNRARAWRVGCGNNLAVRRATLAAVGGFCERIGVGTWSQAACDSELLFRLLGRGIAVAFEPRAVVHHAQPRDAAVWRQKRRGYYRGVSFLARRVHPRSSAAWAMAIGRLLGCHAELLLACVSLRPHAVQRAWAQLRGAAEGLVPPVEAP